MRGYTFYKTITRNMEKKKKYKFKDNLSNTFPPNIVICDFKFQNSLK